jgi:hypothetical protein
MMWASLFTMPLGATEPLFVPAYWSPPSLVDLARTTGFDIESFIFAFGIGGIGAVLYNVLMGRELSGVEDAERHSPGTSCTSWPLLSPSCRFLLFTGFHGIRSTRP